MCLLQRKQKHNYHFSSVCLSIFASTILPVWFPGLNRTTAIPVCHACLCSGQNKSNICNSERQLKEITTSYSYLHVLYGCYSLYNLPLRCIFGVIWPVMCSVMCLQCSVTNRYAITVLTMHVWSTQCFLKELYVTYPCVLTDQICACLYSSSSKALTVLSIELSV